MSFSVVLAASPVLGSRGWPVTNTLHCEQLDQHREVRHIGLSRVGKDARKASSEACEVSSVVSTEVP